MRLRIGTVTTNKPAMKTATTVFLLSLLFSPSLYVAYVNGLNAAMPVTPESLECSPVELGSVDLGAQQSATSLIRNLTSRTVRLSQPVTSCGCVMIEKGPDQLRPGEAAKLRFQYQAPSRPGKIDRQIVLAASDFPSVSWTIPIRGEVVASIWAEPAKIELETDLNGAAEIMVRVHHHGSASFNEIRSNSDEVQIDPLPDRNNVLPIKVRVVSTATNASQPRTAAIQFLTGSVNGPREVFSLPVSWKSASKIQCSPSTVTLKDYGRTARDLAQTVLVRGLDESERERLKVFPLKKWVRVTERRTIGNMVQVELSFDASTMPERVDDDILQLGLDDTYSLLVSATGSR